MYLFMANNYDANFEVEKVKSEIEIFKKVPVCN